MKKSIVCWIMVLLTMLLLPVRADELMDITRAAGYEVSEVNRPKSTIVIDGNTGDILWQDNVDEVRDPASMSKLMTLYLVYEAIANGELSEDSIIRARATDQAIANIYALSNNKIIADVDYTVRELITMTAVPSSNVTTIMLANHLSNNDPDAFIDRMNAKAQELGMTNTVWHNASGAVAVDFEGYYVPMRYDIHQPNQTTARDLAILTYHFLKDYPGILEHTKTPVVTVKAGTPYEETFKTYNYSLPGAQYGIDGVDGLKTGSSPSAGFNYIATIKRGEQRHIVVVMGVGDWSDQNGEYYRHPFGNALIEKSYHDFEYKKLLAAGKHEINGQVIQLANDFYGTIPKGTDPKFLIENNMLSLENGLEGVSPVIKNTVAVEIDRPKLMGTLEVSDHFEPNLLFSKFSKYLPILFIGLLIVLAITLIIVVEGNRTRKTKLKMEERSRRNR